MLWRSKQVSDRWPVQSTVCSAESACSILILCHVISFHSALQRFCPLCTAPLLPTEGGYGLRCSKSAPSRKQPSPKTTAAAAPTASAVPSEVASVHTNGATAAAGHASTGAAAGTAAALAVPPAAGAAAAEAAATPGTAGASAGTSVRADGRDIKPCSSSTLYPRLVGRTQLDTFLCVRTLHVCMRTLSRCQPGTVQSHVVHVCTVRSLSSKSGLQILNFKCI